LLTARIISFCPAAEPSLGLFLLLVNAVTIYPREDPSPLPCQQIVTILLLCA
jgi:hypothetical protein